MFKSHKIKIKTNSATLINISRDLKDISNSLKKDKTFTEKIKDRWWIVSLGSFIFMVGLLIGCYTYIFSGDVNSAIDYVQGYLSSGFYRIVFYLIFSAILLLAAFIIPSNVSLWFYVRHWGEVGYWRRVGWGFLSIAICIFFSFFASYICIFLLGGYHEGSDSLYRYVILSSLVSLILFFILYWIVEVNGSVKYRWINFLVFSLIMIVLTWDPSYTVPIILGGKDSYVSCISGEVYKNGNNEYIQENVFPMSYDSRGVHVYIGKEVEEGNKNSENNKPVRWVSLERKYMYFDKGYSIKNGKCDH